MQEVSYKIYTPQDALMTGEKAGVVDFLFTHLQEFGDERSAIEKAINYAMGEEDKPGGFVIVARKTTETLGVVVVNQTGMTEYIPENILVYIAVHQKTRGLGLGRKLIEHAIKMVKGDIALHCEPDNPARHLYEKVGFESKYMEMRLHQARK